MQKNKHFQAKTDIFQEFSRGFLAEKIIRGFKSVECNNCNICSHENFHKIVVEIIRNTSIILALEPHENQLKNKILNLVAEDIQTFNCKNYRSLIKFAVSKCLQNCTKVLKHKILSHDKKMKKRKKSNTDKNYSHPKLRIIKK